MLNYLLMQMENQEVLLLLNMTTQLNLCRLFVSFLFSHWLIQFCYFFIALFSMSVVNNFEDVP